MDLFFLSTQIMYSYVLVCENYCEGPFFADLISEKAQKPKTALLRGEGCLQGAQEAVSYLC